MLQRFECRNMVDVRNGIMFDFYPGLPHMCMIHVIVYLWHVCVDQNMLHTTFATIRQLCILFQRCCNYIVSPMSHGECKDLE